MKSHFSAIYCLVICLFLLPLCAFSQSSSTKVFGMVKDQNGMPIELVTVRVQGQAVGCLTNTKGQYSLYCQHADSVTIVFQLIGYESRKRTIVAHADSLRLDVMLPEIATKNLGAAEVKGQHIQTGTMQRLNTGNSKFAPSATGNAVEEMVATQAGVSTHNELSSQYNVRGGSFDENCVYLNGIEVYRPMLVRSGEQEGLSVINSDMVEQVNFSSGGFEPKYGDRMSSVLDITYKRPEKFESKVNLSLLGAGAYVGWGNKKVNIMSSVRYKTTKYLLGSMDTHGEYNPNFLDFQTYLSWRPNRRWSLDVLGNVSRNNYDFEPEDRETHFGTMNNPRTFKVYFDGHEKDYFHTYFGAATLTRHFTPETFLAASLSTFTSRESETYDIQGEYWLQEATSQEQLGVGTYMEHARNRLKANVLSFGLNFRTRFTGHILQSGFNWQHEDIEERSREWEMRDSMGYSLPFSPNDLYLIYSLKAQEKLKSNRFSGYVQDTWRFTNNLGLFNLNYGVRISYWDWNKELLISPRASIGLLPAFNENWTFRFATGLYYQAPFYKELRDTTLTAGVATVTLNKQIKSQRSVHFILGADYSFRMMNRPFKFTAELYYKALSNLIPYNVDNVRVVYYGRNSASGYAAGIDLKIFGEFVPGTDSWLTVSLMKTQEKIDGIWVPRPTDQRYNVSLYFTDYFPNSTRWRMTLKAAVAGGLPFGPPHMGRQYKTFRAPAYKRVDVGLSYRLLNNEDRHLYHSKFANSVKNIWLGLDAFNLLGISNVNSYYWVTDITNVQYAVPNYLTGRRISARLIIEF